jgi:hypothetical protein
LRERSASEWKDLAGEDRHWRIAALRQEQSPSIALIVNPLTN